MKKINGKTTQETLHRKNAWGINQPKKIQEQNQWVKSVKKPINNYSEEIIGNNQWEETNQKIQREAINGEIQRRRINGKN